MKKIFTLFLALMTFVVGSQTARAEATENLEIVLKDGMALNDPDYNNEYMGVMSLLLMGQLSPSYSENGQAFVSTATNRTLFYLDGNNVVTIAQDVTKADEFTFTVTDADRMKLSGTFKQFMEPYQTISLYFALFPYNPLEVTIESGMDYFEKDEVDWAINALVLLNQLQTNDDGAIYSVETGKLLFTVKSSGIVTVSEDITPYDNICYVITDEDRETLHNPFFLENRDAIVVNFVPGSGNTDLLTMEVTVESGINYYDKENKDVLFALTLLYNLGQLSFTETQQIVSTKTGKVLLTVSEEGIIVVSSDVTSDDDIFYTFTDADREYFKEEDIEEEMEPYAAIKVHFVAGSGGGGYAALSATLKNGMSFDDGENTWMAIVFLYQYFNQIKMEYELNEEGEFTGKVLWLSKDNKLLFFQVEEGSAITIADGITSADDIIYTITQEDRDRLLEEDLEAYTFLAPYKTVELHFDTGGDGIQPTGIELNKSTLRFTSVGQAHHLIATVYPSDATQSVTWKSDDKQVATVDDKGLITVTGFGETTIHASTANNLVADCQVSVKQFIGGDLGTQGTWCFEDGVLTVDYNGQMPWNCTSKTTDPEVAYRLKWIDLLSQIKEIVITGKDVEIQPYFLFYSGDGDLGQHPDDHVKTLTLGSGVKKVGKQALTLYDLKRVNVYSIDPPVLASDLGESNCFWKRRIEDNLAFLYLPANAGIGYAMMSSEWAYFNHSTNHLDMADNPVGIDEMKSEDSSTKSMKNEGAWYTLDGRQVVNGKLPRGIYINNGKKVVVK